MRPAIDAAYQRILTGPDTLGKRWLLDYLGKEDLQPKPPERPTAGPIKADDTFWSQDDDLPF